MNVNRLLPIARSLMDQHGLHGWIVKLDGGKQRAGLCNYSKRTLSFSRHVNVLRSEEEYINTVLHEIAHALVGPGYGHGMVWEKMARNIGCDGQRCYEITSENAVKGNYRVVCPNNHDLGERFRVSEKTRGSSCPKCSPKFDSRYLLRFIPI